MRNYTEEQFAKVEGRLKEISFLRDEIEAAIQTRNLEVALKKIGALIEKLSDIQGLLASAKIARDYEDKSRSVKSSGVMQIVQTPEGTKRRSG